jgi:hypothetical protein
LPLALLGALAVAICCLTHEILFGRLFPNPVYAKTGIPLAKALPLGLAYYSRSAGFATGATSAILSGAIVSLGVEIARAGGPKSSTPRLLAATAAVSHAAFVLIVGGDWMGFGRFIVPVMPLAAYCTVTLLHERLGRRYATGIVAALLVWNLWGVAHLAPNGGPSRLWRSLTTTVCPAEGELCAEYPVLSRAIQPGRRDMVFINEMLPEVRRILATSKKERLIVASGQAGFVFFFLKSTFGDRLRVVDLCGLSTRDVLDCPALRETPNGRAGHCVRDPKLLDACGLRPDMVFDLGKPPDLGPERELRVHTGSAGLEEWLFVNEELVPRTTP